MLQNIRDIMLVVITLLLLAVAYVSFWVLVLLLVGIVLYYVIKAKRKVEKWNGSYSSS
jgi:Ca2+/Na+ antiporter